MMLRSDPIFRVCGFLIERGAAARRVPARSIGFDPHFQQLMDLLLTPEVLFLRTQGWICHRAIDINPASSGIAGRCC
jgi:hypothetical protein